MIYLIPLFGIAYAFIQYTRARMKDDWLKANHYLGMAIFFLIILNMETSR